MLVRLDRYIVGRFARVLGTAILAFIAIYVVVDLIDHLDDFLDAQVTAANVGLYYLSYIPYILVLTTPVAMLLATMFVIGGMGNANELMAIRSAGIGVFRITWPLLRAGMLVSIIILLMAELVVPQANERRANIMTTGIARAVTRHSRHVCRQDASGLTLYTARYDATEKHAWNVTLVRIGADHLPTRRIDAAEMVWDAEGWRLLNATDRLLVDGSYRMTSHQIMRLPALRLRPADLARDERNPEQMTYLELKDYMRRTRNAGGDASRWEVDLHLKLAVPFANVLMIWIGFPVAARSWRGGRATYIGLTLLVAFIYFVLLRTGQALGRAGDVDPVMAAWFPNALFLGVGAVLFRWTRR